MATVEPPEILQGEEPRMTYQEWVKTKEGQEATKGKYTEKALDNGGEGGIIKSGAVSGGLKSDSKEASQHAERYYNAVRKMKNDYIKIAQNTKLPSSSVKSVKDFIFNTKHDLGNGELEYFEPNYEMAQSWQRLMDGKNIQNHDLTLLRHEMLEQKLMNEGKTQSEAHIIASKHYNYAKEANEYYDKIARNQKE